MRSKTSTGNEARHHFDDMESSDSIDCQPGLTRDYRPYFKLKNDSSKDNVVCVLVNESDKEVVSTKFNESRKDATRSVMG